MDIEDIKPTLERHGPPAFLQPVLAEKDPYLGKYSKVFVKSYGCPHNYSDGEYMAGILKAEGYEIVNSFEKSDIVILNSCTVKNPSQEAFLTLLKRAKEQGKIAIAAGCVPQGEPTLNEIKDCSVVGVTNISRIGEVLEEAIKGHVVKLLEQKDLPRLNLPKIRKNHWIEVIPLSTGCLGQCTFCKTRQARGTLMSYDMHEIIQRAKQVVDEGVTELWLTSEDSGIYGRDIGKSLPELCWGILEVLKPHNVLKIGMTNPPYIMEHMEEMSAILNHPQVYSHMHIPVQSGSNPVLDAMVREYSVEDFELLCDYLTENVKGITLATDIICGFPGETDEDFEKTIELVKKYMFSSVFISQFYPRPGTVAANMKKLDTKIVKGRSTKITKVFESYRTYDFLLGTVQKVWITEVESNKKNVDEKNKTGEVMIGHTKTYAKVIIKEMDPRLMGKCVKVKIVETQKWHVVGVVVDTENVIEEIQPVANYRKEFHKTKVNYMARERLTKLRTQLSRKDAKMDKSRKEGTKHTRQQKSVKKEQNNVEGQNTPNWVMRTAIVIGILFVVIGAIMTYLEK